MVLELGSRCFSNNFILIQKYISLHKSFVFVELYVFSEEAFHTNLALIVKIFSHYNNSENLSFSMNGVWKKKSLIRKCDITKIDLMRNIWNLSSIFCFIVLFERNYIEEVKLVGCVKSDLKCGEISNWNPTYYDFFIC